jgi:hypothetical protein
MMHVALTQLHILQHSLGLDEYGRGRPYRNHYVAGGDDVNKCRSLADLGLMKEHKPTSISGNSPWFSVTPAGINTISEQSPKPPRLSAAKSRYQEYLDVGDCYENFAHFLGYDKPEFETQWAMGKPSLYRMKSVRAIGEWCPTKKEAKSSYKTALASKKKAGGSR